MVEIQKDTLTILHMSPNCNLLFIFIKLSQQTFFSSYKPTFNHNIHVIILSCLKEIFKVQNVIIFNISTQSTSICVGF
jgi:hypothetical protein